MSTSPPIYNLIGTSYNSTRTADPYITSRLLFHLRPQPDANYIDIGCGTGNYTAALASCNVKIEGIDPSDRMLEVARSRHPHIPWREGFVEKIQAANESFDGAIATLTMHHWNDLDAAFNEIHRVLKKNGRLVIFSSTPEQMKGYWLNEYFPHMMKASMAQMPSLENVVLHASNAGFHTTDTEKYFIPENQIDCFLYVGKDRPAMYFDENIRRGISSFTSLSHVEEVTAGLTQLKDDLNAGKFKPIHQRYANDLGDYLFIVLTKV